VNQLADRGVPAVFVGNPRLPFGLVNVFRATGALDLF
jgi:hypothetical protein